MRDHPFAEESTLEASLYVHTTIYMVTISIDVTIYDDRQDYDCHLF
jgi:hypothetical protein